MHVWVDSSAQMPSHHARSTLIEHDRVSHVMLESLVCEYVCLVYAVYFALFKQRDHMGLSS